LTPVFGYSKVKAAVHVKLNFDDVKSEDIKIAPPVDGEEQGMIISMMEQFEAARDDGVAGGIPGTDTNGMGSVEYPYGELEDGETYRKVLREVNYEMNQTTTQIEKAKGAISELSVGIIVDSTAVDEDYTGAVRRLVANAIGVGESYVSVERLPFREYDSTISEALDSQRELVRSMESRELLNTLIICLTALLLGVALLLLARSIIVGRRRAEQTEDMDGAGGALDMVADDENLTAESEPADVASALEALSGRSDSLSELKRFIDAEPETVARLLRNWLVED
jgi:flagellar M-ring protein FliF